MIADLEPYIFWIRGSNFTGQHNDTIVEAVKLKVPRQCSLFHVVKGAPSTDQISVEGFVWLWSPLSLHFLFSFGSHSH